MSPNTPYAPAPWPLKFSSCLLTALALLNGLPMLLPAQWANFEVTHVIFVAATLGLGASLLWQRAETTAALNSPGLEAVLQTIIRYWLAFGIAIYGFAKILKTQFQSPSYRLDMPLGEVDGFGLTWYYFGYAYPFALLIGLLQLGGSVLLLYRRTTLLGAVMLLPVMVNIVLINYFYTISVGAFFNSVIFTLGLVFLLGLNLATLKAAFWDLTQRGQGLARGPRWVSNGLRLLPLAAALLKIESYLWTDTSDRALVGTWQVERLVRNGQLLDSTAWLTDRRAWQRLYFARGNTCAFSANPYRYRPGESQQGDYDFEQASNALTIVFHRSTAPTPDTLRALAVGRTGRGMRLVGVLGADSLSMQLVRVR